MRIVGKKLAEISRKIKDGPTAMEKDNDLINREAEKRKI